jgi:penicillin-binding protein 1C
MVDALRARAPVPAETCFTRTPDLNLRQVNICAISGMIAGPNCPQALQGWFIPGKSPIGICDVHRRVWIDNFTGLRLPGEPDDCAAAHSEVCEIWPSDLAKLFQAAGLPRRAPPALAVSTAAHTADVTPSTRIGKSPRIVSPKAGLIYHVRVAPESGEVLNLEATAETPHEHLHWFVDTTYLGVSEASTALLWKPLPGRHLIRAVDDSGRADSRLITVTTVE